MEQSQENARKLGKFFKAALTADPADIQSCKDDGIKMLSVTDGGFVVTDEALKKNGFVEYDTQCFSVHGPPGGVLEYSGTLSESAKRDIVDLWKEGHKGLKIAGRMVIIEDGQNSKAEINK